MIKNPCELGQIAFNNKIACPAHDVEMMRWLAENTSGKIGVGIIPMDVWWEGWNKENNKESDMILRQILPELPSLVRPDIPVIYKTGDRVEINVRGHDKVFLGCVWWPDGKVTGTVQKILENFRVGVEVDQSQENSRNVKRIVSFDPTSLTCIKSG